ncbi:MAG: prepilin-type N-terminal cleavage/methylation domain-containing protein [SAR324 cluster bacterium]|nr:prepilin-type N-terminal cleavage/methylation domain-containing protein [SAR324 cluster bacterium]
MLKKGFTLIEVMIASTMLLILVAGLIEIGEQTFEQMLLRKQKNELATQLDKWTLEKLNGPLVPGSFQENVALAGTDAVLHWQVEQVEPKLKTLLFQVLSSDAEPKLLLKWGNTKKSQ